MSPQPPMPIPVGSPHVRQRPMLDRWGLLSQDSKLIERRAYSRRKAGFDLWLIDTPSESVVRCKTNDVCDAGLHATSPIGFGLAIGQRFETRIADTKLADRSSPQLAPSLGYATIVRIELQADRGESHRIGFALRFDVPQLVPM